MGLWMVVFGCIIIEKPNEKQESGLEAVEEDSSADTTEVNCSVLSVEECASMDSCAVIQGREITIDEENNCYFISEESIGLGCHSADMGCTEAEEYALDPAIGECTWFSNGCLPQGWESCSIAMEQCP